ncbi:NAD(P)-dependent oxidoreductase [Methylocaldum sp.]|uniref:NAD(P)-dependent oxidoreductase n=1 Tax=Methylocaldum sp. TaxID=1969727 RepID=UPI002D3CD864|nr:NAD(P)-dependent oxidoreductase [Methylocaldum sp.]HYE36095.1 NAD(P)-dependent oxidoreductase [Methylocaldum sp.]
MKAGFIGLGAMGAPMARNVAKGHYLASVWNRTEASAITLSQELNVQCAASPALLASHVDVVLICVSADADVLDVVHGILPALRPQTVVIDMSTVSSDTAREAARLVGSKGADFLDAPVTGGVEGAKNGTLAIMVGGKPETLEKVMPVLETMGSRIVHMGDVGTGQAAKAVNQIMAAGINEAVAEALAFGAALGLDMRKVIDVVSGGAAGNWFLEKRGPTMTQGIFKPGFKLALHHKDLKICKGIADKLGLKLPVTEMAVNDYAKLIAEGHGEEDISALYRLKRPSS